MIFNKEQQVFVLSMFSNLAAANRGSVEKLETDLLEDINQNLHALEPQLETWTVAWGPVVYQAPGSNLADNAMYVARRAGEDGKPPQLVVAISGTNPSSPFGWLIEDFAVRSQVPWLYGNPPPGAKVSLGTFVGFSILQRMKPAAGFEGTGLRIRKFLATQTSSKVDITVAGHSLGGALSPTLTLWLSDTRGQWDRTSNAILGCEPTAGATPGNAAFSTYYDQELTSTTQRIFNRLDIVPHAWEKDDLEKIPGLYEPQISPGALVRYFITIAVDISKNGDYTQIVKNTATELPGQIDPSLIDPKKSDFENFFTQAGFQHTTAYAQLLGIQLPLTVEAALTRAFVVKGTEWVAALEHQLKREREIVG